MIRHIHHEARNLKKLVMQLILPLAALPLACITFNVRNLTLSNLAIITLALTTGYLLSLFSQEVQEKMKKEHIDNWFSRFIESKGRKRSFWNVVILVVGFASTDAIYHQVIKDPFHAPNLPELLKTGLAAIGVLTGRELNRFINGHVYTQKGEDSEDV